MNFYLFFLNKEPDDNNRFFEDILKFSDKEWEMSHTLIQRVFPLTVPSEIVASSPVITQEELDQIKSNEECLSNCLKAFERYLNFLGFDYISNSKFEKVVKSKDFDRLSKNWLKEKNHNYLRITRVLHFLVSIDRKDLAVHFFYALEELWRDRYSKKIGDITMAYWRDTIEN